MAANGSARMLADFSGGREGLPFVPGRGGRPPLRELTHQPDEGVNSFHLDPTLYLSTLPPQCISPPRWCQVLPGSPIGCLSPLSTSPLQLPRNSPPFICSVSRLSCRRRGPSGLCGSVLSLRVRVHLLHRAFNAHTDTHMAPPPSHTHT